MKTVKQKAKKLLKKLSDVTGLSYIELENPKDEYSPFIYNYMYKGYLDRFFIYPTSFSEGKVKDIKDSVISNTFGYYDK